ncbi:MAG: GNAT family N-acetyltransferase [Lachnospiraceae bacterium]
MDLNQVIIRPARADEVVKIAEIEGECFPSAEAATLVSFMERYKQFPECFFVAEFADGTLIGHINGCVTDRPELPDELYHDASLHQKDGAWQTVFGLAVLPEFQHQGVAGKLMRCFLKVVRERGKTGVVLTCKDRLIGFYESFGFVHQGVSSSTHGDAKWNDMLLQF